MNKNRALVSVIMTTYNAKKHVGEAIDSILNQSINNWELVIVDDGSIDSTKDIIKGYCDPRIRFQQRKRHGRAHALNEAVSLTQGEYIANLDADDISLPYRLQLESDFFGKNRDYALVGTANPIVIDGQGKVIDTQTRPKADLALRKALKTYNPFFHSAIMFTKDAWESVGGYNENIPCLIDYEFWIRIASRYKVMNLEEPMSKKREHSDQYFKSRVYSTRSYTHARAIVLYTYYQYIEKDIRLLIKAKFYQTSLLPIMYERYLRPAIVAVFRRLFR